MAKRTADSGWTLRSSAPGLLAITAFFSSGAWFVVGLPPTPFSKALNLATVALWLALFGLGFARSSRVDRRVIAAVVAVLLVVVASYIAGGSLPQAAVYDLFADMPALQWLAFPIVFLLAAALAEKGKLEVGLAAVVCAGAALAAVMAFQVITTNGSGVFGSTAYSVTALSPIVVLGVGLSLRRSGTSRYALLGASALVLVALVFFSGSLMGAVAGVFSALVAVAVFAYGNSSGVRRALGRTALALAAVATIGVLLAQVPAVSGAVVNPVTVASFGKNVVSRAYLWEGAQAMVAERPLLGWGPSGYRVHATRYLNPGALQYGPDTAGNIDPTVYSPQSPHSILWEIGTRLGVLGLTAFVVLLASWGLTLREQLLKRDDTFVLRAALGAAFLTAVFALSVNPVVFPIGLFAAAAAGLAVAPMGTGTASDAGLHRATKTALAVAAVLILGFATWSLSGEWSALTARYTDPNQAIVGYEETLRVLPGHPLTERRLLEVRLLLAADDAAAADAQGAVGVAPAYMRDFAPDLVSFVAYSLAQAERTGRTDVSWERAQLEAVAAGLPEIPSLVAEQLHLAIVANDPSAIRAALPAAAAWGSPYPYTAGYIQRAQEVLGNTN